MSLLLIALSLAGCSDRDRGPLPYTGTIEVTELDVSTVLPGRLDEVTVERGDRVAAGDPIFSIDDTHLVAQLEAMQATVEQARAAVSTVQAQRQAASSQVAFLLREKERVTKLIGAGAGTDQQLSTIQGQLGVAQAQSRAAGEGIRQAEAAVAQAEAAVRAYQAQLDQADVGAPMAGVVLSRNREPGEVVAAGMSVVTLGDLDNPRLRVYVPLATMERLSLGTSVEVRIDAGSIVHQGKVKWIADEAEFTPRDILTPKERVKQVFAVDIELAPGQGLHPGVPADAFFAGE